MRILFWGTPDFATSPLRALIGEGFDVVGVVTQPDRPRGRSRSTLVPPPVKEVALEEGLPVLQPERPRGDEFVGALRDLEPELSVVVAYGHILRQEIIDLPRLGTLNIHASLLPALRGAAPIQAAIRQRLPETGISIMRMVLALDAGPVLHQLRTPISDDETYGELQARLAELGALALVESLALVAHGAVRETPQDDARATYAPKVERADARVAWDADAAEVSAQIRAYDPRPGAFTTARGAELKLFGSRVIAERAGRLGEVLAVDDGLIVACARGAVRVAQVQPAGKGRMRSIDWARGRSVAVGDVLE